MQLDPVDGDLGRPLSLRVVYGPGPTHPILLVDDELRIGREAEGGVGLVLPDPTVSRLHAAVVREGDRPAIVDRGSSNGVYVNGRRAERADLHACDVIRLGDSILVVDRAQLPDEDQDDLGLAGNSAAIIEIRGTVRRVAPSMLPVLIAGPTGTGKELVARALHVASGRAGTFVAVNCAALPATLIESALFGHRKGAFTGAAGDQDGAFVRAHGGTLFLDEIGEMPMEEQPKLLRALETLEVVPLGASRPVPVDVRVVVATNVELPLALVEKRFRSDLYSRLAGIVIHTPPLAARREDVLPLFRRFLDATVAARPMTADFAESLSIYGWPLNVRELRRLAERLAVLHPEAPRWERGMLDEAMRATPSAAEPQSTHTPVSSSPITSVAALEGAGDKSSDPMLRAQKHPPTREELIALLESCQGNVTLAARRAGRNRKQVYRWMQEMGLGPGTGRGR